MYGAGNSTRTSRGGGGKGKLSCEVSKGSTRFNGGGGGKESSAFQKTSPSSLLERGGSSCSTAFSLKSDWEIFDVRNLSFNGAALSTEASNFLKGSSEACCLSTRVGEKRLSALWSLSSVLSLAVNVFDDGRWEFSLRLLGIKLPFASHCFADALSIWGGVSYLSVLNLVGERLSPTEPRLSVDAVLNLVGERLSGSDPRFFVDDSLNVLGGFSASEPRFSVDVSLNLAGDRVSGRDSSLSVNFSLSFVEERVPRSESMDEDLWKYKFCTKML